MKAYGIIKLIPLVFLFLGNNIINAQIIPNLSFEGLHCRYRFKVASKRKHTL